MGWTTPVTWTTGGTVTAAALNAQLRDNLDYLYNTPQVAVRLTSTQSIPNATDTTVSWHEAVYEDPSTMWDIAAPTKIIIPRAGVYTIVFHVFWASSATPTDDRDIKFIVNTSETRISQSLPAAVEHASQLSIETGLALNDELEIQVKQSTGGALNLQATRTRLTVRWQSDPA